MKNSKKLLSIILCFIIIVSATVTSFVASAQSVPAFDETKPYVKATSIPVYPGEETTLTFEIGNNASTTTHKGFWAMRHTLSFDSSVISFVEGETNEYGKFPVFAAGEKFENLLISPISADNEFVFLYTNSLGNIVNNTNNGVLFTIKFKVSEDAQPGTYYFEYKDYKDSNVIDIANNNVAFTYNQPAITVLGEETEPSSTEPSSTEPSSTEPSSTEPSSTEPSSTEPSSTEPSSTEPSSTEPSSTEPSSTEPSSTEPSSTEPSSTEPSSTEPSSTEPSSTEPSSTEPSSTEPSSTEPSSTEPSSTEPSSTEPSSTENPKDPSGDDNFPTVTEPTESTSTTKPSQTTQKVELGTIGSISVKISGKNKVEITYPKVANAKSYEVYRANYGSKSFVRLGKASNSPFVDKTVKGGKKYVYKVRAINGDVYKDSKQSKAVSIMNFKAKAKFKATPAKKNMTVKITGKVKYANGYQVAYSTNAKFKKKLTKTVIFKTKKTIKKLKSGTKYYVRVRAYKTINGKKVYGSWTAKKSIKVK